jgi:hypothetical protein
MGVCVKETCVGGNRRLSLTINEYMVNIFGWKEPNHELSLISKANTYGFFNR